MKIRDPKLISGAGVAGAWVLRRWTDTLDIHIQNVEPAYDPFAVGRTGNRFIVAFYHEMLLFLASYFGGPHMRVLVSDHADGELITQVIERLGFTTVRGSTSRGGMRALRDMARDEGSVLCFTPDGPRGPRRSIQPGAVYMASRLGLPIIPLATAHDRPWRARSWDRMAVARPFTAVTCIWGAPFEVPADADRDTLEEYSRRFKETLDGVTAQAEAWLEVVAGRRPVRGDSRLAG